MDQAKLETQFKKLIKHPTIASYLTKDLYQYISVRGGFIAHFNRQGFHKARFWTLADFDQTISMMAQHKELKELLNTVSADDIAWARYRVASAEASVLKAQAGAIQHHIQYLQTKFTKAIV